MKSSNRTGRKSLTINVVYIFFRSLSQSADSGATYFFLSHTHTFPFSFPSPSKTIEVLLEEEQQTKRSRSHLISVFRLVSNGASSPFCHRKQSMLTSFTPFIHFIHAFFYSFVSTVFHFLFVIPLVRLVVSNPNRLLPLDVTTEI